MKENTPLFQHSCIIFSSLSNYYANTSDTRWLGFRSIEVYFFREVPIFSLYN